MRTTSNDIPAIRICRTEDGDSFFERGIIRTGKKIETQEFWFANKIDTWQIGTHTAPRKQFVITISGKLKFTTSDGESFVIEPGIVLLAEDISGAGHTWEMMEGYKTWHRLYIPLTDDSNNYFVKV